MPAIPPSPARGFFTFFGRHTAANAAQSAIVGVGTGAAAGKPFLGLVAGGGAAIINLLRGDRFAHRLARFVIENAPKLK